MSFRADRKRLKNTDPMYTVAAHIMNKRVDSMNMITIDIPYDPMQEYLNKKRKEGTRLSHMSILVAAYLRTAAEYPELNRFVVNRKAYTRNEISVAMVVLKSGGDHEGTMTKMYFEPTNTVFEVQEIINKFIEENRRTPENNKTEKLIKVLLSIPGLCPLGVGLFKWMDKHGLLPKSIIDASPFHNSLCITNLASIRTNHIYHHCYNFGTTSVFISMGTKIKKESIRHDGGRVIRQIMPLKVSTDERICSGAAYAHHFYNFQKYLANPAVLETPPETVNKDLK